MEAILKSYFKHQMLGEFIEWLDGDNKLFRFVRTVNGDSYKFIYRRGNVKISFVAGDYGFSSVGVYKKRFLFFYRTVAEGVTIPMEFNTLHTLYHDHVSSIKSVELEKLFKDNE